MNQSSEEIVITKNGKPVSRLVPCRKPPASLFGLHQEKIKSNDDLLVPIDEAWDVNEGLFLMLSISLVSGGSPKLGKKSRSLMHEALKAESLFVSPSVFGKLPYWLRSVD